MKEFKPILSNIDKYSWYIYIEATDVSTGANLFSIQSSSEDGTITHLVITKDVSSINFVLPVYN